MSQVRSDPCGLDEDLWQIPGELGLYEWDSRTIKAHRADVRRYFGFRECSVADADKAAEWLAANVFGAAELTGVDVFAAIRDEPGGPVPVDE